MSAGRAATRQLREDGWPTPANGRDGRDVRAPSGRRRLFTDPVQQTVQLARDVTGRRILAWELCVQMFTGG